MPGGSPYIYAFGVLHGYQVGLELTGPNAADAVIANITVDQTKPTYVFAGAPSGGIHEAIDLSHLRMASALKQGGAKLRSYLMRFRIVPVPGAPPTFSVTVGTTKETQVANPNGCTYSPDNVQQEFDF